jgi:hypothetical protein
MNGWGFASCRSNWPTATAGGSTPTRSGTCSNGSSTTAWRAAIGGSRNPYWRRAAEQAEPRLLPASRASTNPWVVENRYRGKAELFALEDGALRPLDYPPTAMLLVTEKL